LQAGIDSGLVAHPIPLRLSVNYPLALLPFEPQHWSQSNQSLLVQVINLCWFGKSFRILGRWRFFIFPSQREISPSTMATHNILGFSVARLH